MSVDRGGPEVAFRGREDRCWRRTSFDLGQQEQRGALLPSGIRIIEIRRSLEDHGVNEITRFFSGASELETKYYRCSPQFRC